MAEGMAMAGHVFLGRLTRSKAGMHAQAGLDTTPRNLTITEIENDFVAEITDQESGGDDIYESEES